MAPSSNARRGKKDTASSSTTTTTIQGQLDRAAETLEQNAFQMARLHGQWRTYLTTLSYLVVLLSFHQFQSISSTCLMDIKAVNRDVLSEEQAIPGARAIALVIKDAAAVVLGIAMATLLCMWLRSEKADFSNAFYMTAQSFILPILGILYYNFNSKQTSSCLEEMIRDNGSVFSGVELPSATDPSKSGWPVVLVFHVIVTLSVWFMNKQQRSLRKSELAVQMLRDDLKKEKDSKKKK